MTIRDTLADALVSSLLAAGRWNPSDSTCIPAAILWPDLAKLNNPVAVAEAAVDKKANTLLMPISARKQLFDLPDDMATRINIDFYSDPVDAFVKAILD